MCLKLSNALPLSLGLDQNIYRDVVASFTLVTSLLFWHPCSPYLSAPSFVPQKDHASLVAQLVKSQLQSRRPGFDPWIGKIPWRMERLPTPVFWPGEFNGLVHGVSKSQTQLSYFYLHFQLLPKKFSSFPLFLPPFYSPSTTTPLTHTHPLLADC